MALNRSPRRGLGSLTVRATAISLGVTVLVALGLQAALRIHFGWCWLIAVNATTFAVYSADKLAAKLNRNNDGAARGEGWRMPEFTLHALALAGGWPAGFAAQATLRHKTIKPEFQRVFRGIMILEIIAIGAIGLWAAVR